MKMAMPHRVKLWVLILLLVAPLAAMGSQGNLNQAKAAYKSKNYSRAFKLFHLLAEQGDADSQLGLGVMYYKGQGVAQDYAKSVKWFRKVAEQGDADGQVELGNRYADGQGIAQDYAKAAKWFRKSAKQGNASGQSQLGLIYEFGQGTPQNYVEAYKWFALAAAQGDATASEQMGNLSQKMTSDQIAKAQELATEWKAVGSVANGEVADIQIQNPPKKEIASSVDTPDYHLKPKPDDFAVVVGVEDYDNGLPASEFSKRDAEAFKNHLLALGVPPSHIQSLIGGRATASALKARIEEWLPKNVKPDSTVFFYFSGHGAPDPATGYAYLVPFDGDPEYLQDTAYPLKRLYSKLSGLKVHQVIVALDSCFSGAGGRSIIAKGSRPLVSKIKEGVIPRNGKLIVLTASKSNQISGVIESAGHGAFTYYFLKGLNGKALNHAAHVTLGSLYSYLAPKVSDAAALNNRDQNPQLLPGSALGQSSAITLR